MSTLIWICIGFTAACVIGVYVAPGIWLVPLGLCCTAGLLGVFCFKSKTAKVTARVLWGFLAGIIWLGIFDMVYLRPALAYDDAVLPLDIELTEYTYETEYGTAAEGKVRLSERTYRIKVYLDEYVELSPGDSVSARFLLRYTPDGGSYTPTYHQGMGIFLLGYSQGIVTVQKAESVPLTCFPAVLARKITNLIDKLLPTDTAGFARALLLGDDRLLSFDIDRVLRISGIRHVIAVSGMHVSILFGIVYPLCGKRRILTALIGIPVLILFAAVAGFSPSIVRACAMQCLMILAMLVNREYDPPAALAFSVLLLLTVNPLTITSVSFQLSVASMIGIFLFSSSLSRFFLGENNGKKRTFYSRVKNWVFLCVSVSLAAMVTTTPLCAYYFGCVSTVSIFTNVMTLWVITMIFCGLVFACVAGAIWLPLGQVIGWAVSGPIRYVFMISNFFSKLPYSAVYTSSVYIVGWLIFVYALLVIFLRNKKRHPAVFAGCIVMSLFAAILCTAMEKQPDGFSVTVVDVGQGQCVLLKTDEQAYLVDCGNTQGDDAANAAMAELFTQGIYKLDGLIVTHFDKDHAGGVNALLGWIPADRLYLPDATPDNDLRKQILQKQGAQVTWVTEQMVLPVEDGTITIYPSSDSTDANESSLCILFQPENYDILITGDRSIQGEKELMTQTELPELELLVAGHHGSGSSTGLELLSQTMPAMVAISVGRDNSYGHPDQQTLQRLELFDCTVLRTDLTGTITFRG